MLAGTRLHHALATASLLFTLAVPARAQVPTLSHSAPRLGALLEIELRGAAPDASVRLFQSRGSASSATPFGTLELSRDGLVLLASGSASPSGRFVFEQRIPLDPALAEIEGHYQALVEAPPMPAGWVLSEAVHLRYIGTRLYATCWGGNVGDVTFPAQLRVLSAIDETLLGIVPLADGTLLPETMSWNKGEREPLFSADLSRGAVVPVPDRLVIFDNFRLAPITTLPLEAAACALLPSPDGHGVLVLESGPPSRILWVDLHTASVTRSLALPWPAAAIWTAVDDGEQAWIGEYPGMPGSPHRTALRRVDLLAHKVLESVPVGASTDDHIGAACHGADLLYVVSRQKQPQNSPDSLTVVDLSTRPYSIEVHSFGMWVKVPTPMVDAGAFVLALQSTLAPTSDELKFSSLTTPLVLRDLRPLPPGMWGPEINYRMLEPDGNRFWALDPCCGLDGSFGQLLSFSFDDATWRQHSTYGWGGPYVMELARDALVYKVYVALQGATYPPPHRSWPSIDALDVATSTWTSVRGGWFPVALKALTVP